MKRTLAIAAWLLLAGAATAELIPGVGYVPPPGALSCVQGGDLGGGQRRYPLDQSALPYGPTGDGHAAVHDPTGQLFQKRWRGGVPRESGWACGYCCELADTNGRTLKGMFAAGMLGSPAVYDGQPTTQESRDFAATHMRSDPLYQRFGQADQGLGTTPESPQRVRLPHAAGGWRYYWIDSPTLGRIHYEWTGWIPGGPCYQPDYPEVLGACEGEPPPEEPEDPEEPEPPPPPEEPAYRHEWLARATVADLIAARPAWILGALPVEDQEALLAAWLAFVDDHPESVGFRLLAEKYAP